MTRLTAPYLVIPMLAAMLLAVSGAHAQDSPAATYQDLVEVSEVLLDVLVTDRQGNVVLGLDTEDFVIEEEGQPVKVTGVSFYSNRFLLQDTAEQRIQHPNEVLADRYFILFIHDQRRADTAGTRLIRQQLDAARQSKRWVLEEMLQGDWVAVVSYDVKLKIHNDFTQDREALLSALDRAARGKESTNQWRSRRADIPEGRPSLLSSLPEGKDLRKQTVRLYDGLRLTAEATRGILGRKNLLLFTIGFGQLDGVRPFATPDRRYYPQMMHALNDNNVAIYPIDLTPPEFEHSQSDFLNQLANDTGGFYHQTFINFLTPMREIADEANGYYLLSFRAQHPAGESGYRSVKVRPRNRDFKVRYRQGYRFGS